MSPALLGNHMLTTSTVPVKRGQGQEGQQAWAGDELKLTSDNFWGLLQTGTHTEVSPERQK